MIAEIKEVNLEDDMGSDLELAIVLSVSEDVFQPVWEVLEKAGFILRNWEDSEIIVYSPTTKKDREWIIKNGLNPKLLCLKS